MRTDSAPAVRLHVSAWRFASFFALLAALFLVAFHAHAATYYWAGGASDRWELANNWASVPKGARGAGVPGVNDVAVLANSGGTVRFRSAVRVAGLSLAHTWTGSLLQGSGSLTVGTSGVRVGSGRIVGGTAAIAIAGGYTQTGGIVTAIQGNFTLSGSLAITKGTSSAFSTFTATGTLILDGGADQNFTIGANVTKYLGSLTLQNSGGGTSDDIVVNVNGGLNLSGALTITLGNLDLTTNSVAMVVERGITLANAAAAGLTTNSNVTASGSILVNDSAVLTVTAGTWTLNDDGDQDVDLDGQSLYNLTVNNSGPDGNDSIVMSGAGLNLSGSLTVTLGCLNMDTNTQTLSVEGNMTLANDALASFSGATLYIGGNFTVNALASFSNILGTITLNGTNQTINGAIVFYNLTKTVTSAATLTFPAGLRQTILGTLTLNGAAGALLSLRSSTNNEQWEISTLGTNALSYLDVRDSWNANTTLIACATGCTDSGNNMRWDIPAASSSSSAAATSTTGGGGGHKIVTAVQAFASSKASAASSAQTKLQVAVGGEELILRDVPSASWFANYVSVVVQNGIASGYRDAAGNPTGLFGPANAVTYAEIAKMALETAGKDVSAVSGAPANNSAQNQWSANYIKLAEDLKLSVYTSSLDVNTPATRGAVVQTILESLGIAIDPAASNPYKDLRATQEHAAALLTATKLGIIAGDTDAAGNATGTVRPNDSINRAEIAKILVNVLNLGL